MAILLWIADVPLTLLAAADGLGIRTNYEALSNLQVIRATWTSMWEPLAFAIGIAALGLFFKFVTDFFFKARFAKRLAVKIVATIVLAFIMAMVGYNLYVLARLRIGVRQLQEAQRQAALGVTSANVAALAQEMESRESLLHPPDAHTSDDRWNLCIGRMAPRPEFHPLTRQRRRSAIVRARNSSRHSIGSQSGGRARDRECEPREPAQVFARRRGSRRR